MKTLLKTTLYSLIAGSLMLAALTSCEKDPKNNGTSNLFLSPSGTVTPVDGGGGQVSFNVFSEMDWTITSNNGWITADITKGPASDKGIKVTLTIAPNPTQTPDRNGSVRVVSGDETQTFLVSQGISTPAGYNPAGLSAVNLWIWQIMHDYYYWNEEVMELTAVPNPKASDPDVFIKGVVSALDWADVQDTSHGENPPTIDGEWNAERTERDHIYSYVTVSQSTRAGLNQPSFGFGFEYFENGGLYDVVVSWVQPDGPAYEAGLRRGMVIKQYANGSGTPAAMTYDAMADLEYQVYYPASFGVNNMKLVDKTGFSYQFSYTVGNVSPVIGNKVIDYNGKRVAYFAYNSFEPGNNNYSNVFDAEMNEAFAEFKAQGVTDLVLDLRYNGGGVVNCAQLLTSLIGDVDRSSIFCKILRNDNWRKLSDYYVSIGYGGNRIPANPEIMFFNDEANSLKLRRVYLLMTKASASASELVVNALKGVDIETIIIGEETNGKNVGMDGFIQRASGGGYNYTFQMRPITFKSLNAKDECDYAGGFTPDYRIDEFRNLYSGSVYELGDQREELLKAALLHIDGRQGEIVTDIRTRSDYDEGLRMKFARPTKDLVMHTFAVDENGVLEMVE